MTGGLVFWLIVLLVQGGDVIAVAFPTEADCLEERLEYVSRPDVLATSACFSTSLSATHERPKVEP